MTNVNEVISDDVVRKIQLLLNLAARTEGNEAEAAAAMARAQEILAKYNLDLAEVQDKVVAGGTAAREQDTKRDYAASQRSAMYQWQRNLVQAIAEANYCRYWVEEKNTTSWRDPKKQIRAKRHKVLGRVVNTTTVMIMVDYLLDTIERLIPYQGTQKVCREAVLWREGCADRLIERVKAKAEEMRTPDYAKQGEQGYCTALAMRDMVAKEEAGNYDAIYGAGAWARDAEYDAQWEAGRAEREQRYALEAKQAEQKLLAESDAERKARLKREAAEARRSERYWDAHDRKTSRQEARRNTAAYADGARTAETIRLDSQVSAGAEKKGLTK
jgi:hypothetical protein